MHNYIYIKVYIFYTDMLRRSVDQDCLVYVFLEANRIPTFADVLQLVNTFNQKHITVLTKANNLPGMTNVDSPDESPHRENPFMAHAPMNELKMAAQQGSQGSTGTTRAFAQKLNK